MHFAAQGNGQRIYGTPIFYTCLGTPRLHQGQSKHVL